MDAFDSVSLLIRARVRASEVLLLLAVLTASGKEAKGIRFGARVPSAAPAPAPA